MATIREQIESREDEVLSKYAQRASQSLGRSNNEASDDLRTVFMRDRDRILHSKPFRRLKYKTQVFIAPVGDHFRTRLTHTLEVAQIARTIGRALRLNEDLIEAIALGHDVGHTPFGHAGEEALDLAIQNATKSDSNITGFKHYEQSLRVLDILNPLNLTIETKAGIGGHSKGRSDLSAHDGEPTSTLEAAVVRIADRIAYLNHDLDDAMRSGLISSIPERFLEIGETHGKRISRIVSDVVENSLEKPSIGLSPAILSLMNDLKEWLFEEVYYRYPTLYPDTEKAKKLIQTLFNYFLETSEMPAGFEGVQGAVDYISGMTDRFAISIYESLFLPRGFERLAEIEP